MKSMPEHACDACNELKAKITHLKHELQTLKRADPATLPAALNTLQAEFGALEAFAAELKTFVTVAFATSAVKQHAELTPA